MKPVVSAMQAWSCVVISAFAIVILSVIGSLFRTGHHEFTGGKDDPDPKVGGEVAGTIFIAVIVYAGFLVFCGLQGMLHVKESRRGAIAL
ncbi:putative Amino acid permease/ SLC12A domain-containing protein [Seiridium cardinale]